MNFLKYFIKKIRIECRENSIKINDVEVTFPAKIEALETLLGEPILIIDPEFNIRQNYIWHEHGISCNTLAYGAISTLRFHVKKNKRLTHLPEKLFRGNIIINDSTRIEDIEPGEIELSRYTVRKPYFDNGDGVTCYFVGYNYSYEEDIPEDKYVIKDIEEEKIDFVDFGFKLSVIQQLMYEKHLLELEFDVYEFAKCYKKRKIDIEEEGDEPIPEVVQYFKDLPIPKRLAYNIEELRQDGGDDIYLNILPLGSGCEEDWDIETAKDAKYFPNLKKVTLCHAKNSAFDEFKKMGFDVEWL